MPRALTEDECREKFLAYVRALISYWEHEDRRPTAREKLEGLAFSILVAIDGESIEVPAFKLIPMPHPDNKEYRRERGENWWPDDCDIAGSLHDRLNAAS